MEPPSSDVELGETLRLLRNVADALDKDRSCERNFAGCLLAAEPYRNEAAAEARSLWHARPTDAASETSRPGEEMWRATGLPAWAVALVLLAVIAIYLLYRVAHLRG